MTTTAGRVEDEVLRFLETRTKSVCEPDQDLFRTGVVTSMVAMELMVFLEKAFAITILGGDLQMTNFRTARSMAELVDRLRGA